MKKITITLLLFTFTLNVFGQQSTVKYTGPKAVPASKSLTSFSLNNTSSNTTTRSDIGSAWLDYPNNLAALLGGTQNFIFPIFVDSSAYFSYGVVNDTTQWGKATGYSIGQTFNAYSSYFVSSGDVDTLSLVPTEGYILDSISVPITYSRLVLDTTVVDTLLINLYNGAWKSNTFPESYFYGDDIDTLDGVDTILFPQMYYNYLTFGPLASYYEGAQVNATITTIKVPLYQSDTTLAEENAGGKHVSTGGISVAAGNLVGCTVSFKPGYTWNKGDTIDLHYNSVRLLALDENYSTGLPLYTHGDYNDSYIVPQQVQYNQSPINLGGWDSSYIPAVAFGPGYQLDDDYVFYHITYVVAGIPQVSSVLSSQSIYPNPSSDQAMLKYTLRTSASVIINVSDITGKIILNINEGNLAAGLNQQAINTQDLADGVYMVSIIANGNTSVSKLVVAR